MKRFQWGKLVTLLGLTSLFLGIGILMQHVLPEYVPFLNSDFWQIIANIIIMTSGVLLITLFMNHRYSSRRSTKFSSNVDDQAFGELALNLIEALGGATNVEEIDACLSRIRIKVQDVDQMNQDKIQGLGFSGIFVSGNQIQAIFGDESKKLQSQVEKILHEKRK